MSEEPTYEVVWPKSARSTDARPPAPRVGSLQGKRVAFLWDYLFRGDELFPELERELTNRFPGLKVIGYETFGNLHGPDEARLIDELPTRLREHGVDAVISGNGC